MKRISTLRFFRRYVASSRVFLLGGLISAAFILKSVTAQATCVDTLYFIDTNGTYAPLSGAGTVVSLSDDDVSGALPIGFTFRFFGNDYTQFYISSNGFITFDGNADDGCCSGDFLPNSGTPNNLIAFAWEDLYPPGGGSITYFTTGTAPSRKLAVNFSGVPHCCGTSYPVTSQVILYEGSNIIEIHTTSMPSDGGSHTMGIENATGTQAYAVPGRNATSWSATNDFVRFYHPACGPNDAGISRIELPTSNCPGQQSVTATLQNYGSNVIDSVSVAWEVDGVFQGVINHSTSLDTLGGAGATSAIVTLGSLNLVAGQSYTVKAWSFNPNGVADTINFNDTTTRVIRTALPPGTYTIGGSSPDYPTFNDAVSELSLSGVCGPVVFDVRNGTYAEQVTIPAIQGTSAANTITFRSESGDSTQVTLVYAASGSADNFTLSLDGASYIRFEQIKLQASGSSYAIIVQLLNGAHHNRFSNNLFEGQGVSSSSSRYALVNGDFNSSLPYNEFVNNLFSGGSYALNLSAGTQSMGTIVRNNRMLSQYYRGIYLYRHQAPVLEGNEIQSSTVNTFFGGIYLDQCPDSLRISKNWVYDLLGGYGIYLYDCYADSANPGKVYNNFVQVGGAGTAYGISLEYTGHQEVLFNNVNINGAPTQSRAMNVYYGTNLRIQNNLFVNQGGGYSFYTNVRSPIAVSDYNNLFSTGSLLAYDGGSGDHANLSSWQQATGLDSNSLSINPIYTSATDLHVNKGLLDMAGTPAGGITDDYDGELRGSPPDMGADEFTPSGTDVALADLLIPAAPFSAGTYGFEAVIENRGATPLSSLNLDWTVNGVAQTGSSWSGNLAPGDKDTVALGSLSIIADSLYTLRAWTSNPNGGADLDPSDDTTSVGPLRTGLSGTYTLGGATPDFPDFTTAVHALASGGVLDSAIFNVRNGTYNEQLLISDFPGADCNTPVVFQGESGDSTAVVLSFSANSTENYTLKLSGAKGVTFRQLTIEGTNSSYGRAVEMEQGSKCNTFSHCVLKSPVVSTTSSRMIVVYSLSLGGPASWNENNVFEKSRIQGGSYGLFDQSDQGFQASNRIRGLQVTGNQFEDQYYRGIYLYGNRGGIIKGNTFATQSLYSSFFGILVTYGDSALQIVDNHIALPSGGYGIYLNYCEGSASELALVANNFISVEGTGLAYGLYINSSAHIGFYYNNVNITSPHQTSALAFRSADNDSLALVNNILVNQGGGPVIYVEDSTHLLLSDYNDLFVTGNRLGIWSMVDQADLSAWQAISKGDSNSVSVNPLFNSSTDLHVNQIDLNGAATPIAAIAHDIDGELRDPLMPDIGADEFFPPAFDAGIEALQTPQVPFLAGNQLVRVVLKNFGTDTLTNTQVKWTLNGTAMPTVSWSGSLASGDTAWVALDTVDFFLGQAFDLVAWSDSPNFQPDVVAGNDTTRVLDLYGALSGTYTLGGSTPDLPDFFTAATVLSNGGILGPVTINVRTGTYNEQVRITDIPGASCTQGVVFQSEGGDSTQVILSFSGSTSSENYVVQLDGADGVTFRQMTLQAGNGTNARVIHLRNGAHCNRFLNNEIRGVATTSSSSSRALIYNESGLDSANQVVNNRLYDGSYGLWWLGSSFPYETGSVIAGNRFEGQYYLGISLQNNWGAQIIGNHIVTQTGYDFFRAIYLYFSNGPTQVLGNQMAIPNGGEGISAYYSDGSSGSEGFFANNFIQIGGISTGYGMRFYYSSHHQVFHNSVHVTNTGPSYSRAFFADYAATDLELVNNLLVNTGGGYALYTSSGGQLSRSDYNDLFTTGATLAAWSIIDQADLSAWQTASSQDSNSVSVDPNFVSDTDLHVLNFSLDALGTPLASVTTDIDGDPRDPATPDMGADEFTPPTEDAALLAISSPVKLFPEGSNDVKVLLYNNGLNTLDSATIHWQVDTAVQTDYHWAGTLLPGDSLELTLGSFLFDIGHPYHILCWVSDPNGVTDPIVANDTIEVQNLYAALQGVYTIGGASPDFASFGEAALALTNGGVLDSVTFNVRDGVYNEQITIGEIEGASATRPIVFQSESGDSSLVTLTYASNFTDNYTLRLQGATHLTFRNLGMEAANSSYGRVVVLETGASYNRFENNLIVGYNTSSTNTNHSLVYSWTNDFQKSNSHNTFVNNALLEGSYGIYFNGYNSSSPDSSNVIEGNVITGQYYTGVRINYQDAARLVGNTITGTGQYYWGFYGVNLNQNGSQTEISGNKVTILSGGYAYGIYLSNVSAAPGVPLRMYNNFVVMGSVTQAYGFQFSSCVNLNLYFNSVNITSSNTNGGRGVFASGCSGMEWVNNILVNSGGGYAFYLDNTGQLLNSDYNDLYSTGTNLGYMAGSNYSSLSTWQTASSLDAHSVSGDPFFVSATDLHVRNAIANDLGTPIQGITTDIDGELRDSLNPDIGADEFFPQVANDAGIAAIVAPRIPFPSGSRNVQVAIRNFGADTLSSANIHWTMNGALQPVFSWTGSLPSGKSDTVSISTYNFNLGVRHDIVAWTSSPNGVLDSLSFNDTAEVRELYPALLGPYTIGGSFPDFPNFSQAVLSLNKGGILGPVTFNVRNGIYTEQIRLGEIIGASPTDTVVFQSEVLDSSQVALRHPSNSGANYTLLLEGTDYVTFRYLTLERTGTGYWSRVIDLENGARHNRFYSNLIRNGTSSTNATNSGLVYGYSNVFQNLNDSLLFRNNRLEGGSVGFFLTSYNSSYPAQGVVIEGNILEGQNDGGMRLYYQRGAAILNNDIVITSQYATRGLDLQNCNDGLRIEQNRIELPAQTGIYLYSCDGSFLNPNLLVNNFVSVGGSGQAYGIFPIYCDHLSIFHNNIHISSSDAAEGRAYYPAYGSNHSIRNNILANTGGGYVIYSPTTTSISQSNYNDLYATGSHLAYWGGNTASNLAAWRTLSGRDVNSLSVDPFFRSNTDLHIQQVLLDSAASLISQVTVDVDGELRNPTHRDIGADEFDPPAVNVGILSLVAPADGCGLSSSEDVTVRILNFGTQPQTGFDVGFIFNGAAPVVENIGSAVVPSGGTYDYTFSAKVDLSTQGSYAFDAYTLLPADQDSTNDTLYNATVENLPVLAGGVFNLLPANASTLLTTTVNFSWSPVVGATLYDLYVWPDSLSQPPTPTQANINQITATVSGLNFGVTYRWTVVAKNQCSQTSAASQIFTIRDLPDLIVQNVQAPANAFSGQPFSFTWEVKNQGPGGTLSQQWFDGVYLSVDNALDPGVDTYLGVIPNLSSLNPNQTYSNSASFTLPNGISGLYYVFVVADFYHYLQETNSNNNSNYNQTAMTVNLTPPPDLIADSISVNPNLFSGQSTALIWKVRNTGAGGTVASSWTDRVYFSADTFFNPANSTILATTTHNGALAPGSGYTVSINVNIPQNISGRHYIYVQTDLYNQVYEHSFETNNVARSDSLTIFLTPPPDLVVTSGIVAPASAANRENVPITWTVRNQGGSEPFVSGWYDQVYLTTNATGNLTGAITLGTFFHSGTLYPGNTYTRTGNVNIPDFINGTYYVYVKTDAFNQVDEFAGEGNNTTRAPAATQILSPDLTVSRVVSPATDSSGKTFTVSWTVKNLGATISNRRWTDKVYLSNLANFDSTSATLLSSNRYLASLATLDSLQRQLSVTLPNGISGAYYLHVYTDKDREIYEGGAESNNVSSNPIQVVLSPWPDLQVSQIPTPDSATAGDVVPVSFTVKNFGVARAQGATWHDEVYILDQPTWNPARATNLGRLNHSLPLDADSSYLVNTTVQYPGILPAGYYYLFVQTDKDNVIYEHTDENNNIARSDSFYLDAYPPIDLDVTQFSAPDSANSGDMIGVFYTVENIGQGQTLTPGWQDAVYLSTDTLLNRATDTRLGVWNHTGALAPAGTYSGNQMVSLPNGLSGDYYLILVADDAGIVADVDVANNDEARFHHITLTQPPDLRVTLFTIPPVGTSGQPVMARWTVANNGTGTTRAGAWTDRFFLSTDFVIDNSDLVLGSKPHSGNLNPGQSYNDSLSLSLPVSANGNFIVLVKTDVNDNEYEHTAENNNTANALITISQPPPSDLIVSEITAPDSAIAGESLTISWKVKNIGQNPATGQLRDILYFSADTIWDPTDVRFGIETYSINLAPQVEANNSLTAQLPGLPLGEYYVIAQTDALNNIYEQSDTNNQTVSLARVVVTVKELLLHTLTPDVLQNQQPLYYRIEIPDSLRDESMMVTLKGDSLTGQNELYIRHNAMPDRTVYDYSHRNPFQGNQEVVVPSLVRGTYYLMNYGSTPAGPSQNITLYARILPFEIRSVEADSGGNTGQVTVRVDGSKFDSLMSFRLEQGNLSIPMDSLHFVDPSVVYVTFNLRGVPLGFYDVVAQKQSGDQTSLQNGFKVVPGIPADLALNVLSPSSSRPNRLVIMTIEFANAGNTDIVDPVLLMTSHGGSPIAFSTGDLSLGQTQLMVPLREVNGPPFVLRPGVSGAIVIYANTTAGLGFSLLLPDLN